MKKKIITVAGRPGSGKSSTAKTLASKLGYEHFSSGELFRELAKERGVDVLQANLSAEDNAEIDHLVDGRLQEIYKEKDKLVVDSRTAWHWMPSSFKVFLDLDLDVAAERILAVREERKEVNEDIPQDPEEYAKVLQRRLDSENRRYEMLYKINPGDMSNYDLVVDTNANNLQQVVAIILDGYNRWAEQN